MKLKLKISNKHFALAGFVAILIQAYLLFGFTGVRTLLSMAVVFLLPFYLLIRKFSFPRDEAAFFAFFMGLGLFNTGVFYFGRVIPSFRASVVVMFIFLLALPYIWKKYKSRKSKASSPSSKQKAQPASK